LVPVRKPSTKSGKMLLHDAHLDGSGQHGQQPPAEGGQPHLPVLLAAVGDVVFAAAAGALHRLARQQIQILLEQGRNALIFETPFDELVQQVAGGRGTIGTARTAVTAEGQNSGQPVHAHEGQFDTAQVEHQVRADPGGLHAQPHLAEFFAATAYRRLSRPQARGGGAASGRAPVPGWRKSTGKRASSALPSGRPARAWQR
jgi:hypothetical protein